MSRKKKMPRPKSKTTKQFPGQHHYSKANDGFVNLATRVGAQAPNLPSQSNYQFDFLTRRFIELEAMYRGSWLVRKAVDSVAKDMVRAGVTFNSELTPDDTELFQQYLNERGIWDQLLTGLKWGRLYGGAIAVMVVDGQDLATPLRIDRIRQGQFRGLKIYIRWQLQPSLNDLVEDGPDAGLPKYYEVLSDASMGQEVMFSVHHSRVIRLIGPQLPWRQLQMEQFWGESIVEVFYDRLIGFDAVTNGMSNLVEKSYLRVINIDGMRDILAEGGTAEDALMRQWEYNNLLQSNAGVMMIDGADTFSTHNYAFGGLSDVILQYQQQLSGALGIPLVVLLGQSPAGMNATGESDIRFYYDNIRSSQESDLRYGLSKLFRLAYMSKFGYAPPPLFNFEFVPLWQTSQKEKVEMAHMAASTLHLMADIGLPQNLILEEAKRLAPITDFFNSINEEDIENAKMPELPGGELPDEFGGGLETPNPATAIPAAPTAPAGIASPGA